MPGGMPLTRRRFLALSTALAQTSVQKQLRPRALRPGDTVGLITPSTYVSDPDRLALAEHTVKYFDLKPKFGKNVRQRNGYLGGSVAERLEDLHSMFADPSVNAMTNSGGTSGACASGTSGSCSYSCSDTSWSAVSNTCTATSRSPASSLYSWGACVPSSTVGASLGTFSTGTGPFAIACSAATPTASP